MRKIKPTKWMRIKSWKKLGEECKKSNLTSLLCCQGLEATKEDSFEDNGWGEVDEDDGSVIGDTDTWDYETAWKQDTMFRMLDENLDYGRYNETEEERDAADMTHSALMDLRCTIAEEVAWAWIYADNGYEPDHPDYEGNEVYDIETAQKMADELVAQYELKDFMPVA